MADIDVQRKNRMVWLWALLALIVLALAFWWISARDSDELATDALVTEYPAAEVAVEPPPAAEPGTVSPAVQEYLRSCVERQPDQMGLEHEYTAGCTRDLIGSIEALLRDPALAQIDAQAELRTAREAATRLEQSGQTAEHARMTREAFIAGATLLDRLQEERLPELEEQTSQLQQTAEGISDTAPLLDQRTAVQDYFRLAGEILIALAAAG